MPKRISIEAVKEKMRSLSLKSNNVHVLSYRKDWAIKRAGLIRVDKIYSNKVDAISDARLIAKKEHANNIVIHHKDGSISKFEKVKIEKKNKKSVFTK